MVATVFFYLTSVFISLFGVLYWYFKKTYNYWHKRNVKSLPVIPIFGSYGHMIFQNRHIGYHQRDTYFKYPNEKFVGGFRGTTPELLVRDPEVIKLILLKDFQYFHDRKPTTQSKSLLKKNLFTLKGNAWNVMRRKLTPTFTSLKMKHMFPLVVETSEEMQKFMAKVLEETDTVEIKEISAKFMTDTIGSCAFGMKMNTMTQEETVFRNIGKMIFISTKWQQFITFLRTAFPNINCLFNNTSPKNSKISMFFLNLVQKIFDNRKVPSPRKDFMDLMIGLKNEERVNVDKNTKFHQRNDKEKDLEITIELIAAQAFVFFIAGYETSSTTLSFAFLELALNTDVQQNLYNEIKTIFNKHGKLTYEAVQEMQYLDAVIDETLRKHPALVYLDRKCNSKYKIPDSDVVLDKGVEVIIPLFAIHNDEKYYPEPEKFMPERFLPDTEKTFHPYSYLPFGDGPRNCIGSRFGKLQVAAGLVAILSKFSIEKCNKTELDPELDAVGMTVRAKGGIWLKIKPRF